MISVDYLGTIKNKLLFRVCNSSNEVVSHYYLENGAIYKLVGDGPTRWAKLGPRSLDFLGKLIAPKL